MTDAGAAAFADAGFTRIGAFLTADECDAVASALEAEPLTRAGRRTLLAVPWCRALAARIATDARIRAYLPPSPCCVQITRFEKSTARNWLVPFHQDRHAPVRERVDDPRLRGWSFKDGRTFVALPDATLAVMVAVRLHVDPCGASHGALRVIPGTHRDGTRTAERIASDVSRGPAAELHAAAGDLWLLRPLLLHASSRAVTPNRRRVLQFLFAPSRPPHGLRWRDDVASGPSG